VVTSRPCGPDDAAADGGVYRQTSGAVGERALSSVGAYQLEGQGIQLFEKIEGDYFTILGLPMLPLLKKLRQLGAIDG
jgi:predicted house-cleaning NTP pyrophosphatase (Maf/HAM1 superfamily)